MSRRILAADEDITFARAQLSLIPSASVLIASLISLTPIVAQSPLLPPLALMIFLGWRLLRPEIWPIWAGLPFGLFDDLMSGNAIGSGMLLWTAIMIGLDLADNRNIWRDYWLDWIVATALLASYIVLSMAISTFIHGGWAIMPLVPQMLVAALLFPFVMRLCARLDSWRLSL